ncbi:putative ABC transporter B family member 8 [Tanacetum coccineum]|uniref:ABC transporter B family member 8 n=1 Tax=Tanacetum coccineum TaxID=301880 RepID=A0ABQ5GRV4_9ASTR
MAAGADTGLKVVRRKKCITALIRTVVRMSLDVQSEQVVQEALDRIMVGITTVVVAHRLNIIRNVDTIAFVSEGKVVDLCYPHTRPIPGFIIRGFPVSIPIPGQLGDSSVNSGLRIGSPSGTGFIAIPRRRPVDDKFCAL